MSKINIRESLRNMDADSCCKYDLLTMYDACSFTDEDKADIAKLLFDKEDPEVIYQKLCNYFCDDDVSELTGLSDVQNVTPFEAIINNVKMGLDQKYDNVFYNDVAGQFEIKSKDTTYTFGLSPVEYETDGISLYVDYNYDMPINYTSIKEASEDILNKCMEKVSTASQSNGYIDDDTMDYTVYDVVEDEGRLCAKCMNESTNSFEDIKLGKVNSDAVNELLNNILNNPNYKLTDDCKRKIANNSAPWGIVMSPSFDITASNNLMSTGDFGGSVSFGESEQCTFENGDRVTDGNRKGTVLDCDSIKVLVDWDYSDTDDIEWVMKEDLSFIDSLNESTQEEIDIENPAQEFSSAATSINSTKLPAIYNMVNFRPGDVVVDFGGGKFDNAVNYLKDKNVTLLVYDPYNRSAEHNKEVLRILKDHGGADAAINSNVLNVIKEPEAREAVLRNIKKITKRGAPIYITVYEGRGDSAEGPTKSGYQLNRKTGDYMDEVGRVFSNVKRKGKLITAINESASMTESIVTDASNIGQGYTAPNMASLVTKAKELEKWVKEYKNSKDKDAFERLLPSFEDNILNYKSEIEEKIKDFDKYWEVHKKAMLDNISEAVFILKNIGIPRLDSKLSKLNESYSGKDVEEFLDEVGGFTDYDDKVEALMDHFGMTKDEAESAIQDYVIVSDDDLQEIGDALYDVPGIQEVSHSDREEPDNYVIIFANRGDADKREKAITSALKSEGMNATCTAVNGSNVFEYHITRDLQEECSAYLNEGYSDDDWIDKMWEAFQGISGIKDISEGKNSNTYVVTFDTNGSVTARARVLLKALIKANLDIELDSTNGSNVFTFTTPTSEWEFIKGKMIKDSDGFLTSYDWYRNKDSGLNIFMFGVDEADPDYADWETESDSEAKEWFNSYKGFDDEEELDESVKSSATAEIISKELKDAAYKLFKTPKWGFETDKEIKDYINLFFDASEDPKTGDIELEVRAELGYDNLMELADVLNKVVEKYDRNSYFDAEQPGIISAVIRYN